MKYILLLFLFINACGPYKSDEYEHVKPSETAFVVKLTETEETGLMNDQDKVKSLEFLEQSKVTTKRIKIPLVKRNVGYGWWSYEWIPAIKVIKVDRAPVTREWVKSSFKGTSRTDQAIDVESSNSIGFWVGATCTASVLEEDAATFLYHFGGLSLAAIMDNNVKGTVTKILSEEFSQRNLDQCKLERGSISKKLNEVVREEYSKRGITVTNVALVGGLTYTDKEIQEAINREYNETIQIETNKKKQAAMEIENDTMVARSQAEAKARKLREQVENEILIAKAQAQAEAAKVISEAQEALRLQNELEVQKMDAEARKIWAEKWNGELPKDIIPSNSPLMLTK